MTIILSLVFVLSLASLTIIVLKKFQEGRLSARLPFLRPAHEQLNVKLITQHVFDPQHRFVHFQYQGHDYHMVLSNHGDTLLQSLTQTTIVGDPR